MDNRLYRAVNGLRGGSLPDHVFKVLANDLPAVLIALVALVFLAPGRPRRWERRRGAVLATAAAGLSLLLNQPLASLVHRAQPAPTSRTPRTRTS